MNVKVNNTHWPINSQGSLTVSNLYRSTFHHVEHHCSSCNTNCTHSRLELWLVRHSTPAKSTVTDHQWLLAQWGRCRGTTKTSNPIFDGDISFRVQIIISTSASSSTTRTAPSSPVIRGCPNESPIQRWEIQGWDTRHTDTVDERCQTDWRPPGAWNLIKTHWTFWWCMYI